MKVYIALLRGINVSGQKKIIMSDLKQLLIETGLQEVVTYIQSGNVVFKSNEKNAHQLSEIISRAIEAKYHFKVPTLVLAADTLNSIIAEAPPTSWLYQPEDTLYFTLLHQIPSKTHIEEIQSLDLEDEKFVITNQCVYFTCVKGYGKAKCNNNFFEKKLKVGATTRNLKTMLKLHALAEN